MPVGSAEDTPLLRQYKSLKSAYPHAVLLFRLGDFYEMFGDDAKLASPILGVVLTHRQGLPMCGVPYHSFSGYAAKLLKAGHRVAIADQMEEPSQAKGIFKREVTRLLTPGTLVEDELLGSSATNYLVAIEPDTVGWGLACVEVSTGEFWATQAINDHGGLQLHGLLARLDPAEVLVPPRALEDASLKRLLPARAAVSPFSAPHPELPVEWSNAALWRNRHLALRAALAARAYVVETQSHLRDAPLPEYREAANALALDEAAIRTLELVDSTEGGKRHSLWGVLDLAKTAMGSRRLRHWILHPSIELPEIERRLNCVAELGDKPSAREKLRAALGEMSDVERVIQRLATRSAGPRDLAALRDSLLQVHSLEAWAGDGAFDSGLAALADALLALAAPLKELQKYLDGAVAEEPPARLSDGGAVREGFDAELDKLRRLKADSRSVLAELEERERRETGISSLKAGYNSVFGYFLEVTKAHQAKVPARFIRKQTLTNAERYITPELKELEVKILGAEDKALRLEARLFEAIRSETLDRAEPVRRFAQLAAELDALAALSERASSSGWTKPTVDFSHVFEIEDGRHPIVEAALPAGTFVPNSTRLDGDKAQTIVLTGPNMGGKSVYLRQNALLAVLAQMGSFVPAKSARIGGVDRILTRIGAQDQLARGESTFMVEMRETSHILRSATARSLILLDEVGRGTSTYDGISIAWAVLEHLNRALAKDGGPRGPRVIFATHYFELTELAELLPGVVNASVEAREWTTPEGRTEVVFLHKISPGPADRSFGIHVAELAGIPTACLARAREILRGLENEARAKPAAKPRAIDDEPTLPLFDEEPVLRELRAVDPDHLTPRQALDLIAAWKKRV
ncbi:MAG TPA: DNA mismatch repair protein MutS [Elusimicrobiota bacterium]|nr:DNA mismatch repair protein MutS [Elusimicrobiota bacterium]